MEFAKVQVSWWDPTQDRHSHDHRSSSSIPGISGRNLMEKHRSPQTCTWCLSTYRRTELWQCNKKRLARKQSRPSNVGLQATPHLKQSLCENASTKRRISNRRSAFPTHIFEISGEQASKTHPTNDKNHLHPRRFYCWTKLLPEKVNEINKISRAGFSKQRISSDSKIYSCFPPIKVDVRNKELAKPGSKSRSFLRTIMVRTRARYKIPLWRLTDHFCENWTKGSNTNKVNRMLNKSQEGHSIELENKMKEEGK